MREEQGDSGPPASRGGRFDHPVYGHTSFAPLCSEEEGPGCCSFKYLRRNSGERKFLIQETCQSNESISLMVRTDQTLGNFSVFPFIF